MRQVKKLRSLLAGNLLTARTSRRLSQQDLAEQMAALGYGWVRQTVSDLEREDRALLAEEFMALALVLDAPLPDLLAGAFGAVPIDYGAAKSLPGSIVRAWTRGVLRVGLVWDERKKRHSAIRFTPEEGGEIEALQALGYKSKRVGKPTPGSWQETLVRATTGRKRK